MARWKLWMVGFAGAAALVGVGACGGSDDDGGGGSTSTATGTGSTTTTSSCYQCADYTLACATGCPDGDPFDLICASSLPAMMDLNNCICAAAPSGGDCLADCAGTCALSGTGGSGGADSGQGGDSANCMACQAAAVAPGAVCETEWNACLADSSI